MKFESQNNRTERLPEPSAEVRTNIEGAYHFFNNFGLSPREDRLLHGEPTQTQLDDLAAWREEHFEGGIEMATPEIFDQKTLLAVSLWRQREGENINYLLGKGAGVEVTLRGRAIGRKKKDITFPYRTHSDFELYGVEYNQEGDIGDIDIGTNEFWKVFGGQEYYPTTRTKGLFNLPPNLLHETAQPVQFGDIEVLVPELELLFLDKLTKPESTPRAEGNDAELLAMTYDLNPEKLHQYAEEYIIKPALEQVDQDVESITSNQVTAITNNLVAKRNRLLAEEGVADKTTVVSELNADFALAPQGLGMKMIGLHSNYFTSLTPDMVNEELVVIDQAYIDALSERIKTSVQEQIEACSSIHARIDNALAKVQSVNN